RYLISNLESGMWNLESGMWNVECGIWNVECGMWNLECGMWNCLGDWARNCGVVLARSSMKIRSVVFDLDGLMFDTEALFYRVSSEALAARGRRFTPTIMQAMLGRRAVEVGHALKTLAGLDEPAEVLL